MYIDPRWELKYLGEDPGGVLVETPDGEVGMIDIAQLEKYAKVNNKLIPKNNINWL